MNLPTEIRLLTVPTPDAGPGDVLIWRGKPMVYCPRCGRPSIIMGPEHEWQFEGGRLTIHPSIICPQTKCGAHFYVTLNKLKYV